jgi:hypothetical protein
VHRGIDFGTIRSGRGDTKVHVASWHGRGGGIVVCVGVEEQVGSMSVSVQVAALSVWRSHEPFDGAKA